MASEKEGANKTAKSLMLIAESFGRQGGSYPEGVHRIMDQIMVQAAALFEYARTLT